MPEGTNISRHGLWLLLEGRGLFVPFEEFPWFKSAPVEAPMFHIVPVLEAQGHDYVWRPTHDDDGPPCTGTLGDAVEP